MWNQKSGKKNQREKIKTKTKNKLDWEAKIIEEDWYVVLEFIYSSGDQSLWWTISIGSDGSGG